MTLLLMEQHEVPLVSFSVVVKAGSVSDPAGKEGVASMTAALLRKGTATRSADTVLRASSTSSAGRSAPAPARTPRSISAEFMKKDLAKGLELVADAMLHPSFPGRRGEEARRPARRRHQGRRRTARRASSASTSTRISTASTRTAARPAATRRRVASITRDDVAKFYETNYTPGGTVMAVVGDFADRRHGEAAGGVVRRVAREDRAGRARWPTRPAVQGRKLLLVDKPDSTQTYFRIGNIGIARSNPDRVLIEIVNTLFGGRFTSMINTELRIKSGLTYGASSGVRRVEGEGAVLRQQLHQQREHREGPRPDARRAEAPAREGHLGRRSRSRRRRT